MVRTKMSLLHVRVAVIFLLLIAGLLVQPVGGYASAETLRRFSGSAYMDESSYGVYAVAEETSAGKFDVRIKIYFTIGYTTHDELVSYQLRLDDGTRIDVPADDVQPYGAPTYFSTVTQITSPGSAMYAVPVYGKGGADERQAVTLNQATGDWDAVIGTVAAVHNDTSNTRLNLRYAPIDDAEVFMQYYNGTPITIINVLPNGWVGVMIGSEENGAVIRGYMKARYLAFGNDVAQVQPAMPTYRSTGAFWLRIWPDDTAPAFIECDAGTDVLVMGLSKTWYYAEVNGVQGYVKINEMNGATAPYVTSQPTMPSQATGQGQAAQGGASLRTFSVKSTTGVGYTVDAVVTEVSSGQFIIDVNIALPPYMMNDVVIGYDLYINGAQAANAARVEQGDAAPKRFKGSFGYSGAITSLKLVPVMEKRDPHTDPAEHVSFTIK